MANNRYVCICGKLFKKLGKYNRHYKEYHLKIRPYKCLKCGNSYKRKTHLARHSISHTLVPKPFKCHHGDCIMRFSSEDHLKRHVRLIHQGQKYVCSICQLKFNKKSKLHKHLFSYHDFQKPYPCTLYNCRKEYFKKSQLVSHIECYHKQIIIEKPTTNEN